MCGLRAAAKPQRGDFVASNPLRGFPEPACPLLQTFKEKYNKISLKNLANQYILCYYYTMYKCFPKGFNMTKIFRIFLLMCVCITLSASFLLPASAALKKDDGILCVSYRGDTAVYESNTLEAIISAFDKGADFVSVSVRKSADGKLVLCKENASEITGAALGEVLSSVDGKGVLILDFEPSLKDEVYNFLESENALDLAVMRINDSAKNISRWLEGKNENLQVIGVYDSFVVFTAESHIIKLSDSGMNIVQYQSKNYFNEMFGSLVSKTIKDENDTKAMVSTYNPDLCGQRSDSEDGWNDLIKKGFSVIETNNLDAFLGYIRSNESIRLELTALAEKATLIETDSYNDVSRENLEEAIKNAQELLKNDATSSDELQSSASKLQFAIDNLALRTDNDAQKGALNVTVGKVIAALLVGMVIFAAQVYTFKMQKGKKK